MKGSDAGRVSATPAMVTSTPRTRMTWRPARSAKPYLPPTRSTMPTRYTANSAPMTADDRLNGAALSRNVSYLYTLEKPPISANPMR